MRITLTYLIRSGWFSAVIKRLLESDREYYLSRRTFLSLTEHTDFTVVFKTHVGSLGVLFLTKDISFSHRTHRSNRIFLRTVSNSQKAFGIQISQNVTAKEECWVMVVRC